MIDRATATAASVATPSSRRSWWFAGLWGFAEATFFFIVPDVFTSRLALQRPRAGFAACGASLLGALMGGLLVFQLGLPAGPRESVLQAFDFIPGINPDMIATARTGLETHGLSALVVGVLAGIPYKLYAVQAGEAGFGLGVFLVVSAVARAGRFILVTGFAWLVGATLFRNLSTRAKLRIHAGAWAVFYAAYFWRMGL